MDTLKPVSTPCCVTKSSASEMSETKECRVALDQNPYQRITSCLTFLVTQTRPDISLATNFLCRSVSNPKSNDFVAAKRVLRCLNNTNQYSLRIDGVTEGGLSCYCDADWGGDRSDQKSILEILVIFHGSPVYWKTTKQIETNLCRAFYFRGRVHSPFRRQSRDSVTLTHRITWEFETTKTNNGWKSRGCYMGHGRNKKFKARFYTSKLCEKNSVTLGWQ